MAQPALQIAKYPSHETAVKEFLTSDYSTVKSFIKPVSHISVKETNNKDSDIWISVNEVAELKGVSVRAIQKTIKKYLTKLTPGNGGQQYRIQLSSLPITAQQKYFESRGITFVPELSEDEINATVDMESYTNAPVYARKKADKYMSILKATEGLKGTALRNYINEWNRRYPEMKTSYQRVVEAKKLFKEQGITGLLAKYGSKEGTTKINNEDFEYFKSLFLKEGAPTLQSCYNSTYGNAIKRNCGEVPEDFPSPSAFLRYLEKNIPEQFIYAARYGESAWNKKYHAYAERDFENIKAGQVWVSDHRQIDTAMIYKIPENTRDNIRQLIESIEQKHKKPVFPWITVWSDFKTGKWLGWFLHAEDPNSDQIFQAFYSAASVYGLPEEIYIDNGKDYRCKDFSGGKRIYKMKDHINETKTRSLMAALNIEVHFSTPYNGQTKPVERDFKLMKEWLDKLMPGYRGGNIKERPEILADEIKRGKIINIEDYKQVLETYINEVLHEYPCAGKKHKGMTRNELWNIEYTGGRRISADALKLFCMRTSTEAQIGRNGIVVNRQYSLYYWAEWMIAQKGKKVFMRRDNNKYQEAWVFDAKTEDYLGRAVLAGWNCAALAETDLEKNQLQTVLKAKKLERNLMKEYIDRPMRPDPQEIITNMAIGIAAQKSETDATAPAAGNVIIKTFMDEVKLQDEAMQRTGTHGNINLADLAVNKEITKTKIYAFAFEKEAAENKD